MEERWLKSEQAQSKADLWFKMWEALQLLTSKEVLVEVEHVKAYRTKKGKAQKRRTRTCGS